jgi:hypothetical protein
MILILAEKTWKTLPRKLIYNDVILKYKLFSYYLEKWTNNSAVRKKINQKQDRNTQINQ